MNPKVRVHLLNTSECGVMFHFSARLLEGELVLLISHVAGCQLFLLGRIRRFASTMGGNKGGIVGLFPDNDR